MDKKLKKKIIELTEPGNEDWNHQYHFPGGVTTRLKDIDSPGYNLNKWERLEKILANYEVKDKTFIDIGCSDGYYSIKIAEMGAKHVTGSDLDPLRIKRANLAKSTLGVKNVDFEVLDLYNTPDIVSYDYAIGLGLLHRIPDMLKCLEKMCKISNTVIVEFKTYRSQVDMLIDHGGKSKSNSYNGLYKTPTIVYIKNRFFDLGFKNISVYEDKNSHLNYPRTIVVASKE